MTNTTIGVFPASGGLGGSTLRHLCNELPPLQITAIVRKPENVAQQLKDQGLKVRAANYDEEKSLDHAFDGLSILNLISYASIEHEHRSKVHKQAIDSARKSGVKHIFYSSLAFAGDGDRTSVAHVMQAHLDTEAYLASLAAEDKTFTYTVVRIGLYSESFPLYTAFFDLKNPTDKVKIPHDGKGPGIAWAKQDELGHAAAKLFASYTTTPEKFEYVNKTILLSGPKAWSLGETVEVLGRVAGKHAEVQEVSVADYTKQESVQNGLSYGAGDSAAEWATAFEAVKKGEAAVSTPLLEKILGREPEGFETTIKGMLKE